MNKKYKQTLLGAVCAALAIAFVTATAIQVSANSSSAATPENQSPADATSIMTVYKTPTCGCCSKWVDHVHDNGFQSKVVELNELSSIKKRYGIQGRYQSCHTGVISHAQGEYIFEGHVPAQYIESFLENPTAGSIGLSVPGMPVGSPGMEVGERKDYYQVLQLNEDGTSVVYAHVNQKDR